MVITISQCRAARAMLGWSAADLANGAVVGVMTVHRFEGGETVRQSSIDKIRRAFEAAGVEFIPTGAASQNGGEGLRLRGG